jgi:hypothetical protein
MARVQEWIHAMEEGAGAGYLRWLALGLVVVMVGLAFNLREFQNMRAEEAMDAAQVARNLAEGRGFTTRYVRPLSMGLVMAHREDRDPLVKGEHPDLAQAPVYPLFLAGFMKVPGLFEPAGGEFRAGGMGRHSGDQMIGFINQGLFLVLVLLSFRLARRLFDMRVAVVTALVMLGSEWLWQFSVSGLSTMLCMVLLMALANVLLTLEMRSAPTASADAAGTGGTGGAGVTEGRVGWMGVVWAAVLVGLLGMTRYSLAWLVIPVLGYLMLMYPRHRIGVMLVGGLVFLAVFTPWLVRNVQVCGHPFGVAGFAVVQETSEFSGNWLARTLEPDVTKVGSRDLLRKFFEGALRLVREELPRLGGSWLAAVFAVGLLVPFAGRARRRLQWFTVVCLVVLSVAQIMVRTHLSNDEPVFNSENLLAVLTPLVLLFGSALLIWLVDNLEVSSDAWRKVILGGAVGLTWLPLMLLFGPPRTPPSAYPPYYPPTIQRVAGWFEPGEWIMTDMPWAVAWYGNRQALLLSLTPDKDFTDISDWQKQVNGLYLTRLSLDSRFVSDWLLNARQWGRFMIEMIAKSEVPRGFPLRRSPDPSTTFPDHLLLADRDRWGLVRPLRPPRPEELQSGEAGQVAPERP